MPGRKDLSRALPRAISAATYVILLLVSLEVVFLPDFARPGTTAQELLFDGIVFLVVLPSIAFLVVDACARWYFS